MNPSTEPTTPGEYADVDWTGLSKHGRAAKAAVQEAERKTSIEVERWREMTSDADHRAMFLDMIRALKC